jgi:hypothetical protein
MVCERPLSCECRRDGILGTREDGEEGISLGVDLAPAGVGEGGAEEPLMVGQHRAVAVAEPGEESR